MQKRIRGHIRSNVIGYAALFLALSGGVAWANHPGGANTISSSDIVNGEVKTGDIGDLEVKAADIAADSLGGGKIADLSVKNADLATGASSSNTIADGGIQGIDVKSNTLTGAQLDEATLFNDNSLTGADVNESTLSGVPSEPTGPAGGDLGGTYPNPTVANVWKLGGNTGTGAADFLGTTDNQPFSLGVNDAPALRLEPASDGTNQSPNVIGGTAANSVDPAVHSATIAGGGRGTPSLPATANRVTDHQGTVGGGANNQAGDDAGSPGDRTLATVGGGGNNEASGEAATVAGGFINRASGSRATVTGGESNHASGLRAIVGGGLNNTASGPDATVVGGFANTADGDEATVLGGADNSALGDFSLAGGLAAQADHRGAFVWADATGFDFASTADNQFNVRATGGARLVSGIDGSGTPSSGLELLADTSGWSTLVNGQPFDIRVNGSRAFRIEPASDGINQSPNVIGGSADNSVSAGVHSATIGGGGRNAPDVPSTANKVTDNYGTVGGGANNRAGDGAGSPDDRRLATVGGGGFNNATGVFATVGGGISNTASEQSATVGGGNANEASELTATVGGGSQNSASGARATVPGGLLNTAEGDFSLAAGQRALANDPGAFVWADSNPFFFDSSAQDQFSVRATGGTRLVSGIDGFGTPDSGLELLSDTSGWATLVNGEPFDIRVNGARGLRIEPASDGTNQSPNVIGGSADNSVSAVVHSATIAGGGRGVPTDPATANRVTDHQGTVGGGANNRAGGGSTLQDDRTLATVGGGGNNIAAGTFATVPGGFFNTAGGESSFAAGRRAKANHPGSFVWADNHAFSDFVSTAENQFSVRATGGVRFVSAIDGSGNPTAGVALASGSGSWSSLSDAASKRAVEPVSGREVLRELAAVPISTWSYRSQDDSIRHIGPMAQDFFRAFGVGEDRRHIASVDADGVALAAIKGLHRELRAERRRRHEQERRMARLEARLAALERGEGR